MLKRLRVPTLKQAQYEYELMRREEMKKKRRENEDVVKNDGQLSTVQLLSFNATAAHYPTAGGEERVQTGLENPDVSKAKICIHQFESKEEKNKFSGIENQYKTTNTNSLVQIIPIIVKTEPEEIIDVVTRRDPPSQPKRKRGRPPGKKNRKRRKLRIYSDDDADDEDESGTGANENVPRRKRMGRPPGSKDLKPRKIRQDYINRLIARNESASDTIQTRLMRKGRVKQEKISDDEASLDEELHSDSDNQFSKFDLFKIELFSHILDEINRRISTQSFQSSLSCNFEERNC